MRNTKDSRGSGTFKKTLVVTKTQLFWYPDEEFKGGKNPVMKLNIMSKTKLTEFCFVCLAMYWLNMLPDNKRKGKQSSELVRTKCIS